MFMYYIKLHGCRIEGLSCKALQRIRLLFRYTHLLQREQLNPAVAQHLIEVHIHTWKTDLGVIENAQTLTLREL